MINDNKIYIFNYLKNKHYLWTLWDILTLKLIVHNDKVQGEKQVPGEKRTIISACSEDMSDPFCRQRM